MKSKQQWIDDEQKQKQILQSLHDDAAGGCHFGRDKTRDKVVSRYFWYGQYDNVDEYIKTCEKCQKVYNIIVYLPTSTKQIMIIILCIHVYNIDKSQVQETSVTVKPILVTTTWDRIGIDLIGPLPATANGDR